jgi:hypothetical protein
VLRRVLAVVATPFDFASCNDRVVFNGLVLPVIATLSGCCHGRIFNLFEAYSLAGFLGRDAGG